MRRAVIYVLLFPLIVAAFMFAAQRINPLKGDLLLVLLSAYAIGFFPAIVSAWTHDALRHRGYRSIPSVFVGAATLVAVVYFVLEIYETRFILAYAVAGFFAAVCCWVISRIGQQNALGPKKRKR